MFPLLETSNKLIEPWCTWCTAVCKKKKTNHYSVTSKSHFFEKRICLNYSKFQFEILEKMFLLRKIQMYLVTEMKKNETGKELERLDCEKQSNLSLFSVFTRVTIALTHTDTALRWAVNILNSNFNTSRVCQWFFVFLVSELNLRVVFYAVIVWAFYLFR